MNEVDLAAFQTELSRLEWIKMRKAELAEMEHEARSAIEEMLPMMSTTLPNDKIVGRVNGKPVVEWRPTKSSRVNIKTLREIFPKVADYCLETSYGRAMIMIEPSE